MTLVATIHQVSACRQPFRCIRCRRPGHRGRFCRARSPVPRDHSPAAHTCSPVTAAPCERSRSPAIQPCPSTSRCLAGVVDRSSLRVSVMPRSSVGCCEDSNASTFFISTLESQVALLRMEFIQKVELLRSELHDALAKLQDMTA